MAGRVATCRHCWQFLTDRMLLDEGVCLRTRIEGQSLVDVTPSSRGEPDGSFTDACHMPFEYGKVATMVAV
jgi:hypothetical protein